MAKRQHEISFGDRVREDFRGATGSQVTLLVKDLRLMAAEEDYSDEGECYREWLRRLGGARNMASYAATLEAGTK